MTMENISEFERLLQQNADTGNNPTNVADRFPPLYQDSRFWETEMPRLDRDVKKAEAQNYATRPDAAHVRDKMITSYAELQAAVEQKDYERANEIHKNVEENVHKIYRTFNVASDP
jgi:hypothetical protein